MEPRENVVTTLEQFVQSNKPRLANQLELLNTLHFALSSSPSENRTRSKTKQVKIVLKIEQSLANQLKIHKLIEAIDEEQRHLQRYSDYRIKLLRLQVSFITQQEEKFQQLLTLQKELDESLQKRHQQMAEENEKVIQERKDYADIEVELAEALAQPVKTAEALQRILELQQKRDSLLRRISETREVLAKGYEEQFDNLDESRLKDYIQRLESDPEMRKILQQAQKRLQQDENTSLQVMDRIRKAQERSDQARLLSEARLALLPMSVSSERDEPSQQYSESQQVLPKLNELSSEEHDKLMLYKVFNNNELKKKIRSELLPITKMMQLMTSLTHEFINEIVGIEESNGNFTAVKELFQSFAVDRTITPGWSNQMIQALDILKLVDLKKRLCPNENDLLDFIKRSGVPRCSLLERISQSLRLFGGVLLTPFGKTCDVDENVPVVHPKMHVVKKTYDNKEQPMFTKEISFGDMIESNVEVSDMSNADSRMLRKKHAMSIFIVGAPGCGKSTIVKRMVKAYNEDNKIAFFIPLQMLPPEQNYSLKNLLLKFPLLWHENDKREPSAKQIERDFVWVLGNQEKCLVVLDGLDEVNFQITDPSTNADINDELPLGELLSLILSRRFLPESRVITAGRAHSINQLPSSIIIDVVVCVNEFSQVSFQILMKHYISSENLVQMLENLEAKSSRVFELIHTPLFLRIFAMLYEQTGEEFWITISTTAKLLSDTFDLYLNSANIAKIDTISDLKSKLRKLAYTKMMARSVLYEENELEKHGLSANDVQDFMVLSQTRVTYDRGNASSINCFQFPHASIQEYLSAEFALARLSAEQFTELLKKIFPMVWRNEEGRLEIEEDVFMNVRVFLIGLINDDNSCGGDDFLQRKKEFIKSLCKHLRQIFVKKISNGVEDHQYLIMKDLMDFRQGNIVEEIRDQLKPFRFWFGEFIRHSLVSGKEFEHFLQNFVTNVECLCVRTMTNDMRQISTLVHLLKGKVEEMIIEMGIDIQRLSSLPCVKDIIGILPKITKKFAFNVTDTNGGRDFDDFEVQHEFWKNINQEIQKFDTSTLQNKELELKFRSRDRLFLSCTLVRGKPSPPIKVIALSSNHIVTRNEYL